MTVRSTALVVSAFAACAAGDAGGVLRGALAFAFAAGTGVETDLGAGFGFSDCACFAGFIRAPKNHTPAPKPTPSATQAQSRFTNKKVPMAAGNNNMVRDPQYPTN